MNLLLLMAPLGTRAEMTWQMGLLLPMAPPWYQNRDDLHATTQNLADEPTLANGPPWVPEQRWLCRWTFFCQWPHPSTTAEMTCMSLHKTWQMNLLWPRDPPPPVPEQRCHEYQYKKLGRWTYFGQWTPSPHYQSSDAMNTSTQNLADEPSLANGPPWYQSSDAMNTTTQNLADEPTLANGPPTTRAEMTCIPLHKTWQMNLFLPMDPPVPEQRWLAYHSSIHYFWDTPLHFLKTCFSLESGFVFLELQKSLLVSFQGCWTQWHRFESSSIHYFWDTPQHFLKTHFA